MEVGSRSRGVEVGSSRSRSRGVEVGSSRSRSKGRSGSRKL